MSKFKLAIAMFTVFHLNPKFSHVYSKMLYYLSTDRQSYSSVHSSRTSFESCRSEFSEYYRMPIAMSK